MAYTTIDNPTVYFNNVLYAGNGSTNAITGVGFQPDWVWIKQRSGSRSHMLFDAIRGATYRLSSDTDEANGQYSTSLTAFGSDGFTLGAFNDVNESSNTFVSWNWKANGSGATNEDGSINTIKTSASTASGFSIVKYQGTGSNATVGHGLGAVPKMIIVKALGTTQWWFTYHISIGNTKHLLLNKNNAESGASANYWNNTTPTSSVFSIGTDTSVNQSGQDFIAYCFAEKQGYSKFGSFVATNPVFVYTGFKPAFVMIKRHTATGNWHMLDNKRANSFNPQDPLYANASDAEQTGDDYDLVSNGFVVRNASGGGGGDSGTAIYMAFAESPFVSSSGIPTTAR
mgnify:CR=1 FL=1